MKNLMIVAAMLAAMGGTAQVQAGTYSCIFKAQKACSDLWPNNQSAYESCVTRAAKMCGYLHSGASQTDVDAVIRPRFSITRV